MTLASLSNSTRNLIISVLCSRVLYGSPVWASLIPFFEILKRKNHLYHEVTDRLSIMFSTNISSRNTIFNRSRPSNNTLFHHGQISKLTSTIDGSNIPDQGAASAALLNNQFSFSCRINDSDKVSFSNRISIYCDNQATLQVIGLPPQSKSNQSVFIQIFEKLEFLISILQFSISLCWCPAHVDILENEKVDRLAKTATEGNLLFDLDPQRILQSKFLMR